MLKWIKKAYKFIEGTFLFLLIIALVSAYIPTDVIWFAPLISFGFPVLLLLYWITIVLRFFRKKRNTFRIAILLLLSIIYFQNQVRFFPNKSAEYDIRMMGFNVRLFDIYNWINREEWADWAPRTDGGKTVLEIYKTIRESKSDVLCLQEFYYQPKSIFSTLDSLKAMGYKYQHYDFTHKDFSRGVKHHYGIGTFSKHPIINKKFYSAKSHFINGALASDIVKENDTVRVVNIHFNSYRFSKADHQTLKKIKDWNLTPVGSDSIKNVFSKMRKGLKIRQTEIGVIDSIIQHSPYSIILSCDLNESPNTAGYKELTNDLEDAFLNAGAGIGNTLVSKYPVRIDYILHSENLTPYNFKVVKKNISDHYPLICDFKFE